MISLTCTHCKAILSVDEAFAGGACRCQHCGTIQTVPRHLKGGSAPARGATEAKTLYTKKHRGGAAGTGLDDLVGAVTSSGLSAGRLRGASPEGTGAARKRLMLLLIAAGAAIVVLIVAVTYLFFAASHDQTATDASAAGGQTASAAGAAASPAKPVAPNFCGVPLADADTVVYVLDRGDSTRDLFGYLKSATYRSISSLGPRHKFQIIFWNNGSPTETPLSYPTDTPVLATHDNINAAEHALDDLTAQGKTDFTAAFEKAINVRPSTIVIATAKAWDLDDSFVATIQRLRTGSSARVFTIALSDPGSSTALKTVADKCGGEYRYVSEADLREFAQ